MQIQLVNHLYQATPTQTASTPVTDLNRTESEQSQTSQLAVTDKNSADSAGHTEDLEEKQTIERLRARDREVRAHEAAHKASAGSFAKGGATFEYQTGPDGKRYAVGGEVSIDTSKIANNPEATIRKAQTIRRAATAPAQPSAQDRSVAVQASKMEAEARQELSKQNSNSPINKIDQKFNSLSDTSGTTGEFLDIFS